MLRFRRMRSLQKFAAVHASVSNHFNQERSLSPVDLISRPTAPPLSLSGVVFAPNRGSPTVLAETGSNSSDSTISVAQVKEAEKRVVVLRELGREGGDLALVLVHVPKHGKFYDAAGLAFLP